MRIRLGFMLCATAVVLSLVGCTLRTEPQGPVADFVATPTRGKPPLTVFFDASPSYSPDSEIVRYYWDFGDGTTDEGIQVTHTYGELGTYVVTLTVLDAEGRAAWAHTTVEVLGTPPVAVIEAPAEAPSWQTLTFDGSGSYDPDGVIVRYLWDFGDGETAEGAIVKHTYRFMNCDEPPITYTVTLEVEDNDGLRAVATHEITIYPVCPLP